MHRRDLLTLALAALASPALPRTGLAAPSPYRLSGTGASITYTFTLNGGPVKGTVPVTRAALAVDPANLAGSTADVTADMRRAKTGLVFATEALKSESVLNTRDFPTARFRSTRVRLGPGGRLSDGASIDGDLTLRGITRPVRFAASLYRARGSAADDFSRLTVALSGQLDRRSFGAAGYADIVAPTVGMDIQAEITIAG